MGPFDDLKHAQRQRLLFLDQCFTWRGLANRKDLVERFGISLPQAAQDFRLYLSRVGRSGPTYDPAKKSYYAAERISQAAIESLAEAFHILDEPGSGASLPRPRRHADSQIVARLFQTMKAGQSIEVRYTSMTSGLGKTEWIAPTHFTSDGEAVHLRAYSFKHREYRNYLPIRFDTRSSFSVRQNEALPADADWETKVRISLRPKQSLSPEQASVVRREYGFTEEFLVIEIRKALEFYFDRRWGLDQRGARLERAKTEVGIG